MLTGTDDTNRIDRLCVTLACVTGLHCLLAPGLAGWAPALSGEAAHLVLALAMLGCSVAATAHGMGEHGEIRVLGWTGAGWLLLAIARLGSQEGIGEIGEAVFTLAAAVLLIAAHQLNRSLSYWHRRERRARVMIGPQGLNQDLC